MIVSRMFSVLKELEKYKPVIALGMVQCGGTTNDALGVVKLFEKWSQLW